jgi:hypothetical protein
LFARFHLIVIEKAGKHNGRQRNIQTMSFWTNIRSRRDDSAVNCNIDDSETDNQYNERVPLHMNSNNNNSEQETIQSVTSQAQSHEFQRHHENHASSHLSANNGNNLDLIDDCMVAVPNNTTDTGRTDSTSRIDASACNEYYGSRQSSIAESATNAMEGSRRGSMEYGGSRRGSIESYGGSRRGSMEYGGSRRGSMEYGGSRRGSIESYGGSRRGSMESNLGSRRGSMEAVGDYRRGSMMTITSRNEDDRYDDDNSDADRAGYRYNEEFNNSSNSLTSHIEEEGSEWDDENHDNPESPRRNLRLRVGGVDADDEFEQWKRFRNMSSVNDTTRAGGIVGLGITAMIATHRVMTMLDKSTEEDDENDKAAILFGRQDGAPIQPQAPPHTSRYESKKNAVSLVSLYDLIFDSYPSFNVISYI